MKKTIKLQDLSFYGDRSSSKYQESKLIEWDRTGGEGPLVFFTDQCLALAAMPCYKKSFKVAWILEPYEINPYPYEFISQNHKFFDLILSHHKVVSDKLSNAKWYPNGMSWIPEKDWWPGYKKTKDVSIIASRKNITEGHQLRHRVIKASNNLDVFGSGYRPIDSKLEALADYRYSVAIENCRAEDYFTEKLLDCFATYTIPIYWGCPRIHDYFNHNGMVIVNNEEELLGWIERASSSELENEYYNPEVENAMHENWEKARKYMVAEDWIMENILIPEKIV